MNATRRRRATPAPAPVPGTGRGRYPLPDGTWHDAEVEFAVGERVRGAWPINGCAWVVGVEGTVVEVKVDPPHVWYVVEFPAGANRWRFWAHGHQIAHLPQAAPVPRILIGHGEYVQGRLL